MKIICPCSFLLPRPCHDRSASGDIRHDLGLNIYEQLYISDNDKSEPIPFQLNIEGDNMYGKIFILLLSSSSFFPMKIFIGCVIVCYILPTELWHLSTTC